jgi:FkbM family methyltransferase
MREKFILYLAQFFRFLPVFRGKYRIGRAMQKIVLQPEKWKKPEVFIRLKEGSVIQLDTRSEGLQPAFWTGIYDTALIQKITQLFENQWIVLDIGANTGWYSIPMAKSLLNKNGVVHAFEPFSTNYNALCEAIKRNKTPNIISHKIALGEKIDILPLTLAEKGNTGNAVLLTKQEDFSENLKTEWVNVCTLDTYFEIPLQRCDFIKMDIEGFEMYLLRGAKAFIAQYRPIIYGEFSKHFMDKNGTTFQEIWDFCEENGYNLYHQPDTFHNITFFPVLNATTHFEDLLLFPNEITADKIKKWIY